MRRVVFALVLLASVESHAQVRNIELTVFDPTPSTVNNAIHVQSADIGQAGDLVIASWLSYAAKPLVQQTSFGTDVDVVVRHRTMLVLGGAYSFERFELGARMPFYTQSGDPLIPGDNAPYRDEPASGTVLGDLAVNGKMPFTGNDLWTLSGALTVKLPTASDGEFVGTDLPSARAVLLASVVPTRQLTLIANAGGVVREKVEYANRFHGSGITAGIGGVYRVTHGLFIDLEAFGEIIPGGKKTPTMSTTTSATAEALLGARYQLSPQYSLTLGGGTGLLGGIGAPMWRGVLAFSYTPSGRPLPPLRLPKPEVPIDLTKEDTDFDKLSDAVDKCPEQREDKDGFQDEDGCPDLDNDGDGIVDDKDKCVSVAEDKDKFEDGDGCPDPDNDRDGVADAHDACPSEPEKINGVEDNDGCPDKGESLVISTPDRLELLESVVFTGNGVAKSSANVLVQLATTLRARADIVRVRIGVHVNPTNKPDKDQALSDRRAAAVRDWLVKQGVQADRIDPKGFGGTKPLVPASQKGAAAINDRVELIILERK